MLIGWLIWNYCRFFAISVKISIWRIWWAANFSRRALTTAKVWVLRSSLTLYFRAMIFGIYLINTAWICKLVDRINGAIYYLAWIWFVKKKTLKFMQWLHHCLSISRLVVNSANPKVVRFGLMKIKPVSINSTNSGWMSMMRARLNIWRYLRCWTAIRLKPLLKITLLIQVRVRRRRFWLAKLLTLFMVARVANLLSA